MIIGNIKDCKRYSAMSDAFARAFAFLEALNEDSQKESIACEDVWGGISTINKSDTMANGDPKPFEAHRKNIDIHFVLQGEERFGYAHVDTLKPITDYNEEQDYILLEGEGSFVILHPGDYCITFPEDAHMPCMPCGNSEKVKKVILKIKDK